jgi:hypothetical protein
MASGYPLQWPEGWPRTAVSARRPAPYKVTAAQAVRELQASLVKLGADPRSIIISTNMGAFSEAQPNDPGVAVYWTTRGFGERSFACDKWNRVDSNIRALGLAAEGLRAMQRAGATQILDRAFQAFGALPAPSNAPKSRPWWEVFELPQGALAALTIDMVEAKFRTLSKARHPDTLNGSTEAFVELKKALEQAREHYR